MMSFLKKLLFPGETDRKVEAIQAESKAMLEDAERMAKRHNDLLRKNGVTLRVYIATGGDKHGN